jgi:hypothetical protein
MKGILESIPEFFQVLIALSVTIILFAMVFQFTDIFRQSDKITLTGKKEDLAKNLADIIQDCWRKNREGLSPNSAICKTVNLKSDKLVTELDVVRNLNCNYIPDNKCKGEDCSFCVSKKYPDQDKISWHATKAKTELKITYSGYDGIIEVEESIPES